MINQQQITKTIGARGSSQPGVMRARWTAILALGLAASLTDGSAVAAAFKGLVSIADGDAFTIVRGDTVQSGTKGVTLLAGDIVETGPKALLVIEAQGEQLLGIGPSTQVYFLPRGDVVALAVLKGWVKADIKSAPLRIEGTRLGIQGHQAVVLLYADEAADSIFDEQGAATLRLRDAASARAGNNTAANQFFRREERSEVVQQPRPSNDFVAKMPVAFRDPLPANTSAKLKSRPAPTVIRPVNYPDIQTWLVIPRDWRGGFIARFRGRLKDPAFFAAMDAHLNLFPEWRDILHPPPPPEPPRPPEAARPAGEPTPH